MDQVVTEVAAVLDELEGVNALVDDALARWDVPPETRNRIGLAVDEIVTNVMVYAYPEQPGTVRVELRRDGDRIRVEIVDDGVPFDPTGQPDADVTVPLEERGVGGLGIHLVRRMVDHVEYRRDADRNRLVLTATRPSATGDAP